MLKFTNPFSVREGNRYQCFGCSPFNRHGLKLEFWDNGDEVVTYWDTEFHYEGFHDILHGGIQATLMDEAASWCVFTKCGSAGVTSEMTIKYHKPLPISKGKITIIAKLHQFIKRQAIINCILSDSEGNIYTTSEVVFFVFPENLAREKYGYPGLNAFSDG